MPRLAWLGVLCLARGGLVKSMRLCRGLASVERGLLVKSMPRLGVLCQRSASEFYPEALWLCWWLHFGFCFAILQRESISYWIPWFLTLIVCRVSEWCYLCRMKFNVSKTRTMKVSGHAQCLPTYPHSLDGSFLKESDGLVTLGVTFLPRRLLRSIVRLYPELQLRGWKLWESPDKYFIIDHCSRDLFVGLSCLSWSTV